MKRFLCVLGLLTVFSVPASAQWSQIGAGGGHTVGDSNAGLFYLDGTFAVTEWKAKYPILVVAEVDFTYTRPAHHDTKADLLARLYPASRATGWFVEAGGRVDSIDSIVKLHPTGGLGFNYDNKLILRADVFGIHGTAAEASAEWQQPFLRLFLFKAKAGGHYDGARKYGLLSGGIAINLSAIAGS
jgi:hypothetical protein